MKVLMLFNKRFYCHEFGCRLAPDGQMVQAETWNDLERAWRLIASTHDGADEWTGYLPENGQPFTR